MLGADVIDVLRQSDGTRYKSGARCAGGGVDWLAGENKELLHCRIKSVIPDVCVDCPLYRGQ